MSDARRELKFQDHIIDSYKLQGGHARKWATDLQVGMPDLICAIASIGVHLIEVKHRPTWRRGGEYTNPLTAKQQFEASKYKGAGGLVFGCVVIEGQDAIGSYLAIFDPVRASVQLSRYVPYAPGSKYDMKRLLEGLSNE